MTANRADRLPPETGPWCVASLECPICQHPQISVYPAVCTHLECGQCGYMIPAPEIGT